MLAGKLSGTGSLKGTLSGTGSLRGTLSGGGVGHGIPSGGEPGQGLIKASDADYDVKWMSILPEDTASGAVASFPDGADDLPMGVVVDIDPVQDLHGFDNPWPGGGGKNLYDKNAVENNKWIDLNATTISAQNGYAVSDFIPVVENQEYYMQAKGSARSAYYDENKNGIEYFTYSGGTSFVAAHTGYVRFTMRNYEALPSLQFEKGSTGTAYAPYSNICPISGWDGAKVTRTGRNLIEITFNQVNASNILSNVFEMKAGTYMLSFNYNGTPMWGVYLRNGTTVSSTIIKHAYNTNELTFTLDKDYQELCISIYYANGISASEVTNIQIEEGSTAHAYEPYQAVTHEIPFSTEVYGGTLNVETGKLVVDRKHIKIGNLFVKDGVIFRYGTAEPKKPANNSTIANIISSVFKAVSQANLTQTPNSIAIPATQDFIRIYAPDYSTTESFAAAFSNEDIVYELATPITLTLDLVEIRSLFGDNNVWADTGDVSVTYLADVQKYIDKKISAAVAAMS